MTGDRKRDAPPAIEVLSVSKKYAIYRRPADLFWEALTGRARHDERWVLQDVGFSVARGEIVGVVGRNGAGKTTLLRIIAGTLEPTKGRVAIAGRVAAILELGTGFNPEYDGRANILMGGLCMGMRREEVERKLPEIVAFSELQAVIDQPLKTYSTGMKMRLAFSTAMAVEADVLIVDEALAVGDALFQAKCMEAIRDITRSGATVFFVSHSIGALYQLCTRAILLHDGRLVMDGAPREVGYHYELLLQASRSQAVGLGASASPVLTIGDLERLAAEARKCDCPAATGTMTAAETSPDQDAVPEIGDGSAAAGPPAFAEDGDPLPQLDFDRSLLRRENTPLHVDGIGIYDVSGRLTTSLECGQFYEVRVRGRLLQDLDMAVLGYFVEMPSGLVLFGTSTFNARLAISGGAEETVEARFVFHALLGQGDYFLGGSAAQVVNGISALTHSYRRAVQFSVFGDPRFEGPVRLTRRVTVRPNRDDPTVGHDPAPLAAAARA